MGWCTPPDGAPPTTSQPIVKKKKGKRPCSTAPPPLGLFDLLAIKKIHNMAPKKTKNTYFFNGDQFEDGLLVKDFGASAVLSLDRPRLPHQLHR